MNVDRILGALNDHQVEYLLIGGMNFLLRHKPVLTYDVDVWTRTTPENIARTEAALVALDASWGRTESDWGPVSQRRPGWLKEQTVFCLSTPHGAMVVFLSVTGLDDWAACRKRAVAGSTAAQTPYIGLSDEDMLTCQEALDEPEQKPDRMRSLREAIEGREHA